MARKERAGSGVLVYHLIDIITPHLQFDAVAQFETQRFFFNLVNDALEPATGDDTVAFLEACDQLLEFLTLFLLWTKDQEVENEDEGEEKEQRTQQITRPAECRALSVRNVYPQNRIP